MHSANRVTLYHSDTPKAPLAVRLALRDKMLETLKGLRNVRRTHSTWIEVDGEGNPEWVFKIRDVIRIEVNKEREMHKLPLVDRKTLKVLEGLALGHSDYETKFALYAAQLALGEIEPTRLGV